MTGHTVSVGNTFGIGSRALELAMAVLAVGYAAVTVYSCESITAVAPWCGLTAGFVAMVASGLIILYAPGDPLRVGYTVAIACAVTFGVVVSLLALPTPTTHQMQTGPVIGTSVIMLAFVAVRGRPAAAWGTSIVISVFTVVWAAQAEMSAGWGLSVTLPGYAIMIMGSLFAVMLRPMTRQIYALREAEERQAALDAASAAAAEVRERELAALDERARPILSSIAERHEFSGARVQEARLLEAQLRDGIRAPGLDVAGVRGAAWAARSRGVDVVLLDDSVRDDDLDAHTRRVREEMIDVLVDVLDHAVDGRVTGRLLPPGRAMSATITVDAPGHNERLEFGSTESGSPPAAARPEV